MPEGLIFLVIVVANITIANFFSEDVFRLENKCLPSKEECKTIQAVCRNTSTGKYVNKDLCK